MTRVLAGGHFILLSLLVWASRVGDVLALESGDPSHAVLVAGTLHYSPEKSMPLLAMELERFGFRTTVVLPDGDPEKSKNGKDLPGLEALDDADVAIFFMRFLTLPDDQLKHVLDYVKSGKPVVGFRTSTHAFSYPGGHKHFRWNMDFGRLVLGTSYIVHQSGSTRIQVIDGAKKHPVLTGVKQMDFESSGSLYLTALQPGCEPLVIGTGLRSSDRLTKGGFGTFYIQKEETDIVAWTWENQWGSRVFCSSFGHVDDFGVEPIMRILMNGIFWATGHPIPEADVEIHTFEITQEPKKSKRVREKK